MTLLQFPRFLFFPVANFNENFILYCMTVAFQTGTVAKRRKIALGIAILVLFGIYSFRQELLGRLFPADILLGITVQALMVMFCVADSHIVQKKILHVFRWIIFFTWPVSVPIYFFLGEGFKRVVKYWVICAFNNGN